MYAETDETHARNHNKPTKVSKTIAKYKFHQINKVSSDYWGDPPGNLGGGWPCSVTMNMRQHSLFDIGLLLDPKTIDGSKLQVTSETYDSSSMNLR